MGITACIFFKIDITLQIFSQKNVFPKLGNRKMIQILGVHFNPKNEEIYNLILMHSMNKKLNNYLPSHHQLPSETDI